MDVCNKRGANIGSDHHFIFGDLKPMTNTRRKCDITKLKSGAHRAAFCTTLHEKLTTTDVNLDKIQHSRGTDSRKQ